MKHVMTGAVVAAVLVASAAAWAGYKTAVPVGTRHSSDGFEGEFWGNLGYARNSANATEYIGCGTTTFETGTGFVAYMWCEARDTDKTIGFCTSKDEKMIQAAASVGTDSYVRVMWNNYSQCYLIDVDNTSQYEPKWW
jgi:hypothetical protein